MIVLDTDILSEFVRKHPAPAVIRELRRVPADQLATTVVNVTELRFGARRRADADRFWELLSERILARVAILPLDAPAALVAGDLRADLERSGTPIALADLLIAAITLSRGASLATGNVRHFDRVEGLRVDDWLGRRE